MNRFSCPSHARRLAAVLLALLPATASTARAVEPDSTSPPGEPSPAPGPESPNDDGEIALGEEPVWTPHRLAFGGGALVAVWEHGATDPVFLGEETGGTYGVIRIDYHYMLNEWLGMGAALELDVADSGYPGYAGVAASVGLRIGLWKEWLYLEAETLTGYPWILGGVANVGFAIPIGSGVRVRLDSRFLFCFADDCPLQVGWFPAFAAEMEL